MPSPDEKARHGGWLPRAPRGAWPHRQLERGDFGSGSYGEFQPSPSAQGHYQSREPALQEDEHGHLRQTHALSSPESSARVPTGMDRDRLSAHGDQGYGRHYGGHRGRGPQSYRRADERILDEVCTRLTEDDEIDATEVVVHVEGGEVTLTGSVETRSQKRRAEAVTVSVLGVTDVRNRLRVVSNF